MEADPTGGIKLEYQERSRREIGGREGGREEGREGGREGGRRESKVNQR